MKICLISNLKDKGYGESTRPHYLSLELHKLGYEILHISDRKTQMQDGIWYVSKKPLSLSNQLLDRIFNFLYLFIKVRLFNPDLIYTHQFNNGQWSIATKILSGITKIYDAHTSLYFECKATDTDAKVLEHVSKVEKEICSQSDYVVAASLETRDILLKEYGFSPDKIFVVKNATSINPVNVPRQLGRENFVCSATLPMDGFISNVLALEFLFEVARKVYSLNKDIQFQVLGGGDKPAPPVPNITYTGYVENLEEVLLKSQLCLSPYPEKAVCGGARNKVCDYLALGKAVVSTKEGMRGFNDLVNGKHYFEANTVEDFAAGILKLYDDIPLRETIETNALAASKNYQWANRAKELDVIFKSIFNKR